jgi:hypothetical protein
LERSAFSVAFERAFARATLPSIYRDFILSDAYLPYRRSYVRGVLHYGADDVELRLDSPLLLRPGRLWDRAGIEAADAAGYHPVAIIPGSSQCLVIDVRSQRAPVFLLHHETGAFHPQFDTFTTFVDSLRTPDEVRRDHTAIRRMFADIRRTCGPAAAGARALLAAGDVDAAAAQVEQVLTGRVPIRYDGRNDFVAIGMLCECFDLRGRVSLARGDLRAAHDAFLDATACGGTPYWAAAVNLTVTAFLLEAPGRAREQLGELEPSDFPEPPRTIADRNFSRGQLEAFITSVRRVVAAGDADGQFARRVLGWLGEEAPGRT